MTCLNKKNSEVPPNNIFIVKMKITSAELKSKKAYIFPFSFYPINYITLLGEKTF